MVLWQKEIGGVLAQIVWSIFPRTKTTMHKNRQRRPVIHLLIIFVDPRLFHDNGMYYCEQNRNNIGQTSNFNIMRFFKSYYCRKRLNTKKFWYTHHRPNFILTCEIENPLVEGTKTSQNFGQICEFEKPVRSHLQNVLANFPYPNNCLRKFLHSQN